VTQPGLFGRKPPKNAPALELARFLSGTVPTDPPSADYLAQLGGGWKMLGNGPDPENAAAGVPADGAGDCVAVTWANVRRLVTATLGGSAVYPTLPQCVEVYKTQNPDFPTQDDGMDIQTLLEYLHASGDPDGSKPVAFAKVNPANAEEVRAAIAIFGYLWTGINVLEANMDEFNAGQPWDNVADSPVAGGHSVITAGYGSAPSASSSDEHPVEQALNGTLSGDYKFITWAQETSFTDAFWENQVEEAWVVIWHEHLGTAEFEQGIDAQQFAAEYQRVTGQQLPLQASLSSRDTLAPRFKITHWLSVPGHLA
jgi:hypothetical protein